MDQQISNPPITPPPTITATREIFFKRSTVIIVIILVIIIGIVAVGLFFKDAFLSKVVQKPVLNADRTISLPIRSDDPKVNQIAFAYSFVGGFDATESASDGIKIKTDIQSPNLPDFIVKDFTRIVKSAPDGTYVPALLSDLRPKQIIELHMFYELRKKIWNLREVVIVKE